MKSKERLFRFVVFEHKFVFARSNKKNMVQIFAMLILTTQNKKPVILSGHIENQGWSNFFYKSAYVITTIDHHSISLAEFVEFFAKLLAQRVKKGERKQVEKDSMHENYMIYFFQDYTAYVHANANDSLVGITITDQTYPFRVGFDLTRRALAAFNKDDVPAVLTKDYCCANHNASLAILVKKFQDPTEADNLLKAKKSIDEAKLALVC